jgi:GNAT superfamily N-acetyltransferase
VSGFEIEELSIPAALDGSPAALDFAAAVDARNAAEVASSGTPYAAYPASELLPGWQESAHEQRRMLAARLDGRIVARGAYDSPREGDAANTAWIQLHVHPEFTGRGIGRALADALEALAVAEGRTQVHVYATSPPAPGPRLDPPTGFGSVPAENREVRFLLARGYTLGQVNRGSRLPLPVDPGLLAERRAAAESRSAGYRVHLWQSVAPERWLPDLAALATRMSTDAPSGGLDEEEDLWTVERWLEAEAEQRDAPRVFLYAAVEHVESGHLVGYTELVVPDDVDRPADQGDTIVMREHRGHRLGMLLKIANIEHLMDRLPGHPSITTFNAEENRHMLDVNEAVGFVPFAYEGAWQKKL